MAQSEMCTHLGTTQIVETRSKALQGPGKRRRLLMAELCIGIALDIHEIRDSQVPPAALFGENGGNRQWPGCPELSPR